jgi:hypothetical protein
MNSNDIFNKKVIPIMDKVMKDLRHKQLEEIGRHTSSLSYIMAGAAGPDGGMAAQAASLDSLRYTGKWNSKHTEDYILLVKEELRKQKITVTPDMEKRMIDKMIKDEIPRSSIEYILKKAASNTIFYLPQAMNKSPLENHISEQAEKKYNPSRLEKGTGYALGAAADYLTMGGIGGSWSGAARFVGIDLAANAVLDKSGRSKKDDIPLIIDPKYREQYKAEQAKKTDKAKCYEHPKQPVSEPVTQKEASVKGSENNNPTEPEEGQHQTTTQSSQNNADGWSGLLNSFGLKGMSDVSHNLGYILAMMPELLVGMLTGKTRMKVKDNLIPIASIVAGLFVRNPLLKMVLISMGGANLINKGGHEILEDRKETSAGVTKTNYMQYSDQPLNPRIQDPELRGNCLIATIDKVPCTITLSPIIVDACNQGALPLNTLANAILKKNDQMKLMAQQNYRDSEVQQTTCENYEERQQNIVRPLAQR